MKHSDRVVGKVAFTRRYETPFAILKILNSNICRMLLPYQSWRMRQKGFYETHVQSEFLVPRYKVGILLQGLLGHLESTVLAHGRNVLNSSAFKYRSCD